MVTSVAAACSWQRYEYIPMSRNAISSGSRGNAAVLPIQLGEPTTTISIVSSLLLEVSQTWW